MIYGRKGKAFSIPKTYDQSIILTISFNNTEIGRGRLTDTGFHLLQHSRIMMTYEGQNNVGVKKIISDLLKDKLLIDEYPYYILKSEILLHSASTAARLVNGNSRNGHTCWKKGDKSLRELLK